MPAKFGPWVAAALAGALALAVSFGISELLPESFSAAGQLNVPADVARETLNEWPDASQVNRWLARPLPVRPLVKVELATADQASAPPRILVTAAADTADAAAGSINEVLRAAQVDLQTVGSEFAGARHRSLLTLLHHARAEYTRSQDELDRLVTLQMNEVTPPPAIAAATPSASPSAAPVPTVQQRNPLWDDLMRLIAEMEGRRAGLLQSMTPAHPVIRDLDWRIAQLREQLKSSSEFTTAPDPNAIGPLPVVEMTPAVAAPPVATSSATLEAIRQQRSRVAEAELHMGMAIQQEREAWEELTAIRSEIDTCIVPAIAPTHPDPSVAREQVRWGGVLFALALSAATLWRYRPRRQVLRTVDDVQRSLGIPVLGKLSAPWR